MSILITDNVVKAFEGHLALDHVSIEVPEGSIFGLLGPNGAGKTTLLRIINQITAPDSGSVHFYGRPLQEGDVLNIGYLPEERGLYRKMKVGEQCVYLARLKGMSQTAAIEALKKWFTRFGIQGWWNKKISELSKGMAQKIQFITTVVHNPKLLILDEPFSGFDPVNVDIIRTEILRMKNEGVTVILSTHNMESVEEMCDHIALVNKSKLILSGKVNEVRRQYGDNKMDLCYQGTTAVQLPESDRFTVLNDIQEDDQRRITVQRLEGTSPNHIIRSVMDAGVTLTEVKELIPHMRDIFIKLVLEKE